VDKSEGLVKALQNFYDDLVRHYGSSGTLLLLLLVFLIFVGWNLYQHWKSRRDVNEALAEKERSIQRLASQERAWRAYFFRQQGLSNEEIDSLLLRNDFANGAEARQHFEKPRTPASTSEAPQTSKSEKPERPKGKKR
jgi:hypothetical protein